MKITPLEIRQHTFEKTFRGYEIEEVDSFLASLSQEWDRVLNESKMLRMQLEIAEKEANKLREIEMTLFKTLKTAEDTSTMITNQANQQAEKQIGDAQGQSENIIAEAELKAKSIIKEAQEKASYVKEEVMGEVHDLQKEFKNLEKNKNELVLQLKSLASGTVDHVNRFEQKFNAESIDNKVAEAEKILADDKLTSEITISEEPIAHVEEAIAHVEEIIETPTIVAETESETTEVSTVGLITGIAALGISAPAVAEIVAPTIVEPVIVAPTIADPIIEVPAVAEIVAPTIVVPTIVAPTIADPITEVPAVAEIVAPTIVEPVIEVPAVAEIVAPTIVAPTIVEPVIEVPAVAEIVAPAIVAPTIVEPAIVEPVIEVPAVAEIVAPAIVAPTIVEPAIVEPVIEAPVIEDKVSNFFGDFIDDVKEAAVDIKESVVGFVSPETKPEPIAVAQNASEQITDEMLERVNKVKLAIKKAMLEKPDVTSSKSDEKGGSFFDEI